MSIATNKSKPEPVLNLPPPSYPEYEIIHMLPGWFWLALANVLLEFAWAWSKGFAHASDCSEQEVWTLSGGKEKLDMCLQVRILTCRTGLTSN